MRPKHRTPNPLDGTRREHATRTTKTPCLLVSTPGEAKRAGGLPDKTSFKCPSWHASVGDKHAIDADPQASTRQHYSC